jgi:hypothetical protein
MPTSWPPLIYTVADPTPLSYFPALYIAGDVVDRLPSTGGLIMRGEVLSSDVIQGFVSGALSQTLRRVRARLSEV